MTLLKYWGPPLTPEGAFLIYFSFCLKFSGLAWIFPFDKLEKKEKKIGAPWPRHSQREWPRQKIVTEKSIEFCSICRKNFSLDFISSSSRFYHLTHPDKTLCPNKNRLTRTVLFNTLLLALAIHINLPIKTVIHRSEVIHAGIYLSCCSYKFPVQRIYRINWEQLPQYRPL